jgi:hypothetical protein
LRRDTSGILERECPLSYCHFICGGFTLKDEGQFLVDATASTRAFNGEKLTTDEKKLLVHMAKDGDYLHDGFTAPKGMSKARAQVAVLGLESKGSLWCSCFQDSNRAERKYIGGHVYRVRYKPRKRRPNKVETVQTVTSTMPQTPMDIGDSVTKKREVTLGVIRGSDGPSEDVLVTPRKGGRPRVAHPLTPAEKMRAYRNRQRATRKEAA